jgi:hypothetical protein
VAGLANDVDAFRLGLLELISRGALRADHAWVCGPARRWRLQWLYSWGPHQGVVYDSALMPLLDVHARAWQRGHWAGLSRDDHDVVVEGVRFKDLMYARSFWRASWHGYLEGPVAAALERRGMRTSDGELTPTGWQAGEQLEHWLRLGTEAAATRNAAWERAYLERAGSAALLIPEAVPALAVFRAFDPTLNLAALDAGSGWFDGFDGFDGGGGDFAGGG